ncbi:MAG: AsmA family protein [Proteobacteria bacterium]|nr:AsmA family protein [Pseudomonadota bacterium]
MTDNNAASSSAPVAPKKGGLLKKLGIAAAALLVLLVVAYFVVTGAMFQKGVVLPRVAKAIGADLTVEDTEISPFSSVVLRGVKLQIPGGEPIFTAKEIHARYNLMDIIRGNIAVEDATVSGATINVVQHPDGTFNFTPILKATESKEPKAAKPAASGSPSAPPKLNIKSISVKDSAIRFAKTEKSGARMMVELGGVNLTVANIQNGQTAKLTFGTDLKFEQTAGGTNAVDALAAKLASTIDFTLKPDLLPQGLKGGLRLDVAQARGGFSDANGLGTTLDLDLTMTDIKQLALKVARGQQQLATISASGPFDAMKQEGKLRLDIAGLDKNVLNVVGAKFGLDFGNTSISFANEITLAKAGKSIAASGQFAANNFGVTQQGTTTPPLDLKLAYQVAVDLAAQSATISAFTFTGTRQQQPLLSIAVSKPLPVSWNTNAANNVGDSELALNVTGLNLADWRPFLGKVAPDGRVDVALQVAAQNMGKKLGVNLTANVAGLTAFAGTNKFSQLGATVSLKTTVDDFKRVNIETLDVKTTQSSQPLANVAAAGTVDVDTMNANLGVSLAASLTRASMLVPVPGVKVAGGQVSFAGRVVQQVVIANKQTNTTQTLNGKLNLSDFSGGYEKYAFDRLTTAVEVDADFVNGVQAVVRKLAIALTHAGQAAGTVDVAANYDLKKGAGTASVKVANLNENLLRPVLAPSLGDMKLTSGNINLTLDANYNPTAETLVKADVQVARLQISDPAGKVPNVPLDLRIVTDAAMRQPATNQMLITIKQLAGGVNANGKLGGSFDVTGNFDTKAAAGAATVKLTDFNESLLGPVLASALGDKKLVSVTINANANAKFAAKGESALTADLSVARFLMTDPKNTLPTVPMDLRVAVDGSFAQTATNQAQITVRKLTGNIAQGAANGGNFDVVGNFDTKKGGQFTLKLADLNQNALKPFVGAALGDKQLQTVSINANASGKFDLTGDSTVKADMTVDKLVIRDPKGSLPETPLFLQVVLDGGMAKQVVDVKQLMLSLTPTARGKNQIVVAGRADLSDTNAFQANFKVNAESIDVTTFYDLFDNAQKKAAATQPAPAPQPPTTVEPPAMKLPLRQTSLDVNIGKFFLRDIAISNIVMSTKVDANRVTVKPLSLVMNGAGLAATVDANLGVPGYTYDVALNTDRIQLEPMVTTFASTVPQGAIKGEAMAKIAIRGAGVTGPSLQKNLQGSVNFSVTNGVIQLSQLGGEPKTTMGKLMRSLTTGVLSLIKPIIENVAGIRDADLLRPPVDYIATDVTIGNGIADLSRFVVHSPAVIVDAKGQVKLAAVTTNSSVSIPVEIWLPSGAAKLFLGADIPAGSAYGRLPHFVDVQGTVGSIDVKVDKLKLGGSAAVGTALKLGGAAGGKAGEIIKGAGGVVGGLGNLFGGSKPATNAPAGTTNAAPAPSNPLNNLLNNPFFKKK